MTYQVQARPKRILVTGGAGFIGSHLCTRLCQEGHEVICLDNFFTGCKSNIAALRDYRNFEYYRHDVENPIIFEVDQVYHLACPASPVHYQINAVKTVRTNVLGTMNMLELCAKVGAKMLQASTSEVYGDPEIHPQVESYWGNVNTLGPRACYDEGKRVAETLCVDYRRQFAVDAKIVRIFNTYGPRMALNDGRVVSNFARQALLDQNVSIYGEGQQTRSFCYVDDLVGGLISMMNHPDPDFLGPVNLGNPHESTILELAEVVIRLANSRSKIDYMPLPEDDPRRRNPDISLAREKLGWQPVVPLEEGLKKTIAYFEEIVKKVDEHSHLVEPHN
jgi:UDP-glucuronate decarboxylase